MQASALVSPTLAATQEIGPAGRYHPGAINLELTQESKLEATNLIDNHSAMHNNPEVANEVVKEIEQ